MLAYLSWAMTQRRALNTRKCTATRPCLNNTPAQGFSRLKLRERRDVAYIYFTAEWYITYIPFSCKISVNKTVLRRDYSGRVH